MSFSALPAEGKAGEGKGVSSKRDAVVRDDEQ